MKLLFVDNFDSFTYNIVHIFKSLGISVDVIANTSEFIDRGYDFLVIGPGPGGPKDTGVCKELILLFAGKVPILGICLGHQIIGEFFGGSVIRARYPMHGKSSLILHNSKKIFEKLPDPLKVMRYHSLVVDKESVPPSLEVIATTNEGEVMALSHKIHPIYSVQFHPESVGSDYGQQLLKNFLCFT